MKWHSAPWATLAVGLIIMAVAAASLSDTREAPSVHDSAGYPLRVTHASRDEVKVAEWHVDNKQNHGVSLDIRGLVNTSMVTSSDNSGGAVILYELYANGERLHGLKQIVPAMEKRTWYEHDFLPGQVRIGPTGEATVKVVRTVEMMDNPENARFIIVSDIIEMSIDSTDTDTPWAFYAMPAGGALIVAGASFLFVSMRRGRPNNSDESHQTG